MEVEWIAGHFNQTPAAKAATAKDTPAQAAD